MMDATTAPVAEKWAEPVGRGIVYRYLAVGLAYPSGQHRLDTTEESVLRGLTFADAALDALLRDTLEEGGVEPEVLRPAHTRLFPQIESRDCPTYETAYRGRDVFGQAHLMADVAAFYRAHGLRVGGDERERPDHIATELEFMGFLARKEAYALAHLGRDEVDECRRTQATFLRDHLGCWGGAFGRRVSVVGGHPFYRKLGAFLAAWLDGELSLLGVESAEVIDGPLPEEARYPAEGGADVCMTEVCSCPGREKTTP